jgi:uncharacterized protein
MLLDELHEKRDAIQTLSRRYGARRIRVFGSVARRKERADSDVDFLVDFPRAYDLFGPVCPAHAPSRSAGPITQTPG